MKKAISKSTVVLSIITIILIFLLVKYGIQAYREHVIVAKMEKSLNQPRSDAIQKHPDIPASNAIQQEAREQASKAITSETDDVKRVNSAAAMFWGFYLTNVREHLEFCREQGVDVHPFVDAFLRRNSNELAMVRSIFARSSFNENELYTLIKPEAHRNVVENMSEIAASRKISIKEACQLCAENPEAFANEMRFSELQPAADKVMSSAK